MTNIASECLDDLDAALDCFDITFQECGCVTTMGSLAPELRRVLELFLHIDAAYPGHG